MKTIVTHDNHIDAAEETAAMAIYDDWFATSAVATYDAWCAVQEQAALATYETWLAAQGPQDNLQESRR